MSTTDRNALNSNAPLAQPSSSDAQSATATATAGLLRSKRKSGRRGAGAKMPGLSDDSLPGISSIIRQLEAEFKPATASESIFVEQMAYAQWRIRNAGPEISALIKHTSEQYADDSSKTVAIGVARAIEKLSREGDTLAFYQRYIRDAQRQFVRAADGLKFVRENAAILRGTA